MITIIAIVGMAGVGKDTSAEYLEKTKGWALIHSYTNRPMREGETQGKEHIFVSHKAPDNAFAYTKYGNYEYWTQLDQFENHKTYIYIIDENGLYDLYNNSTKLSACNVIAVNIIANKELLQSRGVDVSRTNRDTNRTTAGIEFDYVVINNGSLKELYSALDKILIPDI